MAFWDDLRQTISNIRELVDIGRRVVTDSGRTIAQARAYRLGRQPAQLKVRPGQYDDNLILNFIGLIIDRTVSQMVGGGVEFHFEEQDEAAPEVETPEGETPEPGREQEEYIDAVWDANHKEILLHRAVMSASEAGTGYLMIHDPAIQDVDGSPLMGGQAGKDGRVYPRLVLLDPAFMTMDTAPEDFEIVTRYTQLYRFTDLDGREAQRKRVIEHDPETDSWLIQDFIASEKTGGKFVNVSELAWPYPFAPVIHWQNLPSIDSPYGEPDVTADVIELQDKINAVISWLNKALRLGVHPKTFGRNLPSNITKLDIGPDQVPNLGEGTLDQLPPVTDWAGALALFGTLKRDMFSVTRTVDLGSMEDKLGALTNFALKVLYQDNASKIATKRELMGDALEETNRRLQLMAGMPPLESEVIWSEFMPKNELEKIQETQLLLDLGLISKATAAERLGIDYEDEAEKIQGERTQTSNIGALILRNFNGGQGLPGVRPAAPEQGRNTQTVGGMTNA